MNNSNIEATHSECVDLESISNALLDAMPDVQEHAIAQSEAVESEKEESLRAQVDSAGTRFDPNIHKSNKSGEPTRTKTGKFIKKPASSTVKIAEQAQTQAPQPANASAECAGAAAAGALFTAGVVLGGEEWAPIVDKSTGLDERVVMQSAFADYFRATGKTDFPPSVALAVVVLAYVAPRFTMPKTQTRYTRFKNWIVKKIADRKLAQHNLKAVDKSA